MKSDKNSEILIPVQDGEKLFSPRIIALWAFSESVFGGILHALRIPFRGLFISSAAVLFISLLALFSKRSKEIPKATLIVILVKAIVSPHSPLTAYFAILLQGLLGFLFFSTKKFYKLSALLLGLTVLFISGIQKIVVLTILFGNTLWESIDIFIKQVSVEMFKIAYPDINYGYVLVAVYILIHLIAGLFIGFYAGKFPQKINYYKSIIPVSIEFQTNQEILIKEKEKKQSWFLRPTGIFIIVLSSGVIILSYLSPKLEDNITITVFIMLVRAIFITALWYLLLAPIATKLFQKFITKRKSEYSEDLEIIISMFPKFKEIVNYCWKNSEGKNGIKRISYFLSTTFYTLLLTD